MCTRRRTVALVFGLLLVCPALARAQQLAASGDITVNLGAEDSVASGRRSGHPAGFFNYTDYKHDALRLFRVSLQGMWKPIDRLAFLGEVRSEDVDRLIPYALYVRVRPWPAHKFDVQAGRIPPVFGAFARRAYGPDNPLIGVPLAYQYLTSIRPDAIPANADELLSYRGRGWQTRYTVGSPTEGPGVPIVTAYRWDIGVEAHYASGQFDAAFAVTSGTLSNPRVGDDNGGKQWSGRLGWTPVVGLVLGASAADGEFLTKDISKSYEPVFPGASYRQRSYGFDAEYSRGYWIVRGEFINTRWNIPSASAPIIENPLRATAAYVEGKYRLTPRYFVAARVDRMTFSNVIGQTPQEVAPGVIAPWTPGVPTPWDAPVTRVEYGGGVYLMRNLTTRIVYQQNWRDAPPPAFVAQDKSYVSVQVAFWF
jgi:hypothetical protein